MTTAIVPLGEMDRMAVAFAKSALFGSKTPEQCMALLLLAQAEGQHPAIAMRDFDVIQNRPAKKAEAMLRSFIAAGGSVEWHEMSDTKADASFCHPLGTNGKPLRISWDMERAKKAGLSTKDNWQKYGRQMLANRVISEGCRRAYPAATSGMYEPGEVRQMVREDKRKEKDMGDAEIVADERASGSTPPPPPADIPPAKAAAGAPSDGKSRADILRELCVPARMTVSAILLKAGVATADELSADDFEDACAMLRRKAAKVVT